MSFEHFSMDASTHPFEINKEEHQNDTPPLL